MAFGYKIYFTERFLNRVLCWDPDSGNVTIIAGGSGVSKPDQQLNDPYGLAVDLAGHLLIADKLNHRICRLSSGKLKTIEAKDKSSHRSRLPNSPPNYIDTLFCPTGIWVEPDGSLLAAYSDDHTIYRIQPDGTLELVLGVTRNHAPQFLGVVEAVAPSQVPQTPLYGPTALVRRKDGTLFFIERGCQQVRQFHPQMGLKSVFRPSLYEKYRQHRDAPSESTLNDYHPSFPSGLALDAKDSLYLADVEHHCILQIDLTAGKVQRKLALNQNQKGCICPCSLAFGPDGTAWVLDFGSKSVYAVATDPTKPWRRLDTELSRYQGSELQFAPAGAGIVCSGVSIN